MTYMREHWQYIRRGLSVIAFLVFGIVFGAFVLPFLWPYIGWWTLALYYGIVYGSIYGVPWLVRRMSRTGKRSNSAAG